MKLEETLKRASIKVWKEMAPTKNPNFKIHEIREEGLSSMALKELDKANCKSISKIEMIPGSLEKERGYDFEICIGNPKKEKYTRFFIQAKRLYGYNKNSKYKAYDAGQTKKLESFAKRKNNRSIPLYALFNHLIEPDEYLKKCYNSQGDYLRENLGITIAATSTVKRSNIFDNVHYWGKTVPYRNPFLRYHPNDLDFKVDPLQVAVPFSELAHFSIEKAEKINAKFEENQSKSTLRLLLLLGLENMGTGDELIPILRKSEGELIEDFYNRVTRRTKDPVFTPNAIVIINKEEKE